MNEVKTVVLKKDFYESSPFHSEQISNINLRFISTLPKEKMKNKRDCQELTIQRQSLFKNLILKEIVPWIKKNGSN